MFWNSSDKNKDFSGTTLLPRCYESHPHLKLGTGTIYGGSASSPAMRDADVYVALQEGAYSNLNTDPWDARHVLEVRFPISDQHAPINVKRFKRMITWLCNQLQEGKTVHVGCIGGHGRTGIVLSAIVAQMLHEKNAIQYVRKHYCKKVVESEEQVRFLMKHYGVTKAPARYNLRASAPVFKPSGHEDPPRLVTRLLTEPVKTVPEGVTDNTRTFVPVPSARSLWKAR